jgi:sortase (surface protein transpeptidase)
MTSPSRLARGIQRIRRRRVVVGVALLAVAAGAAFGFQTLSTRDGRVTIEAAAVVATATPTPTRTSTPTTTPTSTPTTTPTATPTTTSGPGWVTTSGMYFPPPPPRGAPAPGNEFGIASISAPALGVDHYVEILGVTNGYMDSPNDGSYAVGYYPDYSTLPGESGNVIMSAHETWNHQQGPFYQMHKAKAGDEISIGMTDGSVYRYRVMSNTRYDVETIPMGEVIWPSKRAFGEQWLTLITCGGRIVYDASGFGEYLDRDVVIAKRVT